MKGRNTWRVGGTLKRCLGGLELEHEIYLRSTTVDVTQRGLRWSIEQHVRLRRAQESSCALAEPSNSKVSRRDLLFGLQALLSQYLFCQFPIRDHLLALVVITRDGGLPLEDIHEEVSTNKSHVEIDLTNWQDPMSRAYLSLLHPTVWLRKDQIYRRHAFLLDLPSLIISW